MGTYSLSSIVNNISGGIINSKFYNGFIKNPIIAATAVTLITLLVIYMTKSDSIAKVFIFASLCNSIYLFFHTYALKSSIGGKQSRSNLIDEFTNIKTESIKEEEIFKPPEEKKND